MPNIRWLLAFITRTHRFVYLKTGGRLGGRVLWIRMLMLVNIGRKSGREYHTPLLYIEDAGRFVVVASNAGDPRDPAWWLNLQARPEALIQRGRERIAVRWRRADEAEDAELWSKLTQAYAFFPQYREKAGRDIPVVILEPIAN
jgi:deazaflavin-dependent oxidoreductase (nitroreductase family)